MKPYESIKGEKFEEAGGYKLLKFYPIDVFLLFDDPSTIKVLYGDDDVEDAEKYIKEVVALAKISDLHTVSYDPKVSTMPKRKFMVPFQWDRESYILFTDEKNILDYVTFQQ